jgi:protein-serine/threonine kinase
MALSLQTDSCLSLVLQYAAGGELYTRMKSSSKMSENCAKFYIGQIALALKYLHDKRIVYRYFSANASFYLHCI